MVNGGREYCTVGRGWVAGIWGVGSGVNGEGRVLGPLGVARGRVVCGVGEGVGHPVWSVGCVLRYFLKGREGPH